MACYSISVYAIDAKEYLLQVVHGQNVQTVNFMVDGAKTSVQFGEKNTLHSITRQHHMPEPVALIKESHMSITPLNAQMAQIKVQHVWTEGGLKYQNESIMDIALNSSQIRKIVLDGESYEFNISQR